MSPPVEQLEQYGRLWAATNNVRPAAVGGEYVWWSTDPFSPSDADPGDLPTPVYRELAVRGCPTEAKAYAELGLALVTLTRYQAGETQATIGRWIDETFPGSDPNTPRKALRVLEELVELCLVSGASAQDIDKTVGRALTKEGASLGTPAWIARRRRPDKIPAEMADVEIVLRGMAQLHGVDLQAEVDKKMAVNRGRRWKANGDGTGYHVKEGPWTPQNPPRPTPEPTGESP